MNRRLERHLRPGSGLMATLALVGATAISPGPARAQTPPAPGPVQPALPPFNPGTPTPDPAPPPGTEQNPSDPLDCGVMRWRQPPAIWPRRPNGVGGATGVMQKLDAPTLAAGGAWTSNAPSINGRTTNFNYQFGDLNTLLAKVAWYDTHQHRQYKISRAVITVLRGTDMPRAAKAAVQDVTLLGSASNVNWSDSVFDNTSADDWSVWLTLEGTSSSMVSVDWKPFSPITVACRIPVKRAP